MICLWQKIRMQWCFKKTFYCLFVCFWIASILNISFPMSTEDVWNVRPKWKQKPGFCEQDVLFQELITSVSLPLKMNPTCCSVLTSPWRTWRAQSSKFTTPVCHGWAVRITVLRTAFMMLLVELLSSLGCLSHTSVAVSVCLFQNARWPSAPGRATSCLSASAATSPQPCWTTAPWWVTAPDDGEQTSVSIGS